MALTIALRSGKIMAGFSALCLLSLYQPVRAQDDPKTPEQIATEAAEMKAALLDAQAKLVKGQADLMKARLDALGLTPASGTTTLKEGAGEMEGWMLSAGTINRAGTAIATLVTAKAQDHPVLLVEAEEKIDFSAPIAARASINSLLEAGRTARNGGCVPARGGDKSVVTSAFAPLAAIGSALSLLKTDTEISKIDVDAPDSLLVSAVAANPGNWLLADELTAPPRGVLADAVDILWRSMLAERHDLAQCREQLGFAPGNADKVRIANIDVILSRINALDKSLTDPREGKSSLLLEAMRLDRLLANAPYVLRLSVQKTGGSLFKRSNVWTALGAPAIGLTGGLVARYTLSDPTTGEVKTAGLLVCRTALTNFNAIHDGRVNTSNCDVEATSNGSVP